MASGHREWEVVVLNDDAIVPPGYVQELSRQMRSAGAAAAGYRHTGPVLHKKLGPTRLGPDERLPGHAFMLAGEHNLRFDERLRWWCGDNDMDLQARRKGGTLILPGDPVQHLHPDESTASSGVLQHQTGLDMKVFVDKWGFRPW
jgi:GT2 family glycosyltransferase